MVSKYALLVLIIVKPLCAISSDDIKTYLLVNVTLGCLVMGLHKSHITHDHHKNALWLRKEKEALANTIYNKNETMEAFRKARPQLETEEPLSNEDFYETYRDAIYYSHKEHKRGRIFDAFSAIAYLSVGIYSFNKLITK